MDMLAHPLTQRCASVPAAHPASGSPRRTDPACGGGAGAFACGLGARLADLIARHGGASQCDVARHQC